MKLVKFALWFCAFCSISQVVIARSELDPEYKKAVRSGAKTQIKLLVVDDDSVPVAGADVSVLMGMLNVDENYWIKGSTDANGYFALEGKTCGHEISIEISKRGYYDSVRRHKYLRLAENRQVKDGKWQPWGAEERIVLRKIQKPVELKRQYVREFRKTAIINEWVGFDLECNDFVAPGCKGKCADFDVRFVWDGKWLPDYTGMSVEIRFTQEMAGGYWIVKNMESAFKGVYSAEKTSQYSVRELSLFEKISKESGRTFKHFEEDKALIVRSRCVLDTQGNLVRANYASINKLGFSCDKNGNASLYVMSVFNPTPNDANLEDVEQYQRCKRLRDR